MKSFEEWMDQNWQFSDPVEICENCGGSGEVMEMKCYGDMPIERWVTCPECDGEG